jgi:hypothetical protein
MIILLVYASVLSILIFLLRGNNTVYYDDYYRDKSHHAYNSQSFLKKEYVYEAYKQSFLQTITTYNVMIEENSLRTKPDLKLACFQIREKMIVGQ